jgi:hypothetical protein
MRRVPRRVFAIATSVSLLLCVAIVVFWVRSRFGTDNFLARWHDAPGCDLMVESVSGRIEVSVGDQSEVQGAIPLYWTLRHFDITTSSAPSNITGSVRAMGMMVGYDDAGYPRHYTWIVVPHWMLLLASASLAGTPLVARQRRTARKRSCCLQCGYCLIGNVSGICPECGSPVARRVSEG